jgi:asparagine synthase (glutamine-hydrolysing)
MAAHAGVFSLDGHIADGANAALVEGLRPLSPDGPVTLHAAPGIAIAQAAFHVWAGESTAQLPARSPAGLVIAWDGRLDNRDDLVLRLGSIATRQPADAAIAAAAFERWGIDGLGSLIGEWSLAIWNRTQRTLHLARDYMAVRPLYYCVDDHAVLWSTSLEEIVRRSNRIDALSDEFAARFMALRPSNEGTPYKGIFAAPAATCLSFAATGAHTRRRFWELTPATVRYGDRRQYEGQLRALWSEAVSARLRTRGTVWAELSGGFDSSAVVCMADAAIKSGRVTARTVQPLSYVTLESPEGDERRFIGEVEARTGTVSQVLGVEAHEKLNDPELSWVTPFAVTGVALAGARHVVARGGRVVLSGRAGDVVMGCQPDNSVAALDDFATGRPLQALANMRRWSLACRKPFLEIAWQLGRTILAAGKAVDRRASEQQAAGRSVLTPALQRIAGDRSEPAPAVPGLRASQRQLAARLLGYAHGSQLSCYPRPPGVVFSYPYVHRPLVEFVLAIPAEQLSAPGDLRWLMRRAFDGLVPSRILRRISKGYYPPAMLRALRPIAAAMRPVDRLEVVQRGWIDPRALDAAIRLLVDGGGGRGEVESAVRLEQWLDSRRRRAPAAIPQRKEVSIHEVLNA